LSSAVWQKMGGSLGWLALVFIILNIISGLAWDVRTSNLLSTLTGGFLNRMVATDLHTYVLIPLVLTLVIHIALGVRSHLMPKGRIKANDR
jgi:succinate dehydrogenase/fumarate reductase cytochrome b subunit